MIKWVPFDARDKKWWVKASNTSIQLPEPPLELLPTKYDPFVAHFEVEDLEPPLKTAELIQAQKILYPKLINYLARPNDVIFDITYGTGGIWRITDTTKYFFVPSDIRWNGINFRYLPYSDSCADIVVYDPPYVIASKNSLAVTNGHHREDMHLAFRYGIPTIKSNERHGRIAALSLILSGLNETYRILRNKGFIIFKIQNFTNDITHILYHNYLTMLGFEYFQIYNVINTKYLIMSSDTQKHARRSNSYIMIYRKIH